MYTNKCKDKEKNSNFDS